MFQHCWAQSVRHNAVDGFRLSRLRNGQRIVIWDLSQRRTDAGSDPNNAECLLLVQSLFSEDAAFTEIVAELLVLPSIFLFQH